MSEKLEELLQQPATKRASLWQTSQRGGAGTATARDLPACQEEKKKWRDYVPGAREIERGRV